MAAADTESVDIRAGIGHVLSAYQRVAGRHMQWSRVSICAEVKWSDIVRPVARVRVVDVLQQGGSTWVVVECHEGSVSVDDSFAVARRSDGSVANANLHIDEIWLPTGAAGRAEAPGTARLRLSGQGTQLLEPNLWLESWATEPVRTPDEAWWQEQPYTEQDAALASGFPRLEVDEPRTLSRASTAFRIFLLIPHLLVLYIVAWGVIVALLIGWFGALVTARLPNWVAQFLSWYLRYTAGVYSYAHLATDRFPPFGPPGRHYPIRPSLPPPARLNRWSVLFRLPLTIPVWFLNGVLGAGWLLASPVIWLVVLVKGRYPRSLLQASSVLVRYSLHTSAYGYLMTSTYPGRLFSGESPVYESASVAATPTWPQSEPARQVGQPRYLSKAAKQLVATFMVLGIVAWVGYYVIYFSIEQPFRTADAQSGLASARQELVQSLHRYVGEESNCRTAGEPFDCELSATVDFRVAVHRFRVETAALVYPSYAQDDAATLQTTSASLSAALNDITHATNATDYVTRVHADDLVLRAQAVDDAFNALAEALNR